VKVLHIFKPGRHTPVNGPAIEFTESDLQACAAAYDPAKHEAPLVVGHPKMDDPAYGWTKSLAFTDGQLVAEPWQVDAGFAEMVNAGRFKKISASFYLPGAPNNPAPGAYYLRHIGFLGAAAPAVKGLKPASFAEAEEGVIEFSEPVPWRMRSLGTLLRNLREWVISKNTIEEADRVLPSYLIDDIESAPGDNAVGAAYAETHHEQEPDMKTKEQLEAEAKLKADQEALARARAEFAEREKALRAEEEKARRKAIADFVGDLVEAGKILPRDQEGLVAYMAGPNEAGVIEFADPEDASKKQSVAPDAWLRGFLEALPRQVDFAERSAADTGEDEGSVSFAAPPGYSVDAARLELHARAIAYQKRHPNTGYDAAVKAVSQ
jgi:hypothetical protein